MGHTDLVSVVSVGTGLEDRFGAFVEYSGAYDPDGNRLPQSSIMIGGTGRLDDRLQLDTSFGFGLSEAAGNWLLGAGLSLRRSP